MSSQVLKKDQGDDAIRMKVRQVAAMGKHAVLVAALVQVASFGPSAKRRRCKYCVVTNSKAYKNGETQKVTCHMYRCENYNK